MTRPLISRRGLVAAAAIIAFVVVLAMFIAPDASTPDEDGDPWTGRWLINGVSAQNTEYSGSLTILLTEQGYELQWLVTGDIAIGEGRLGGGRLAATWRSRSAITGEATGTATYVIDSTGVLHGSRTIDGVDGVGTEEGELAR